MKNETEEYTNKCKDISCSWVGKINNVKMTTTQIYRFSATPSKMLMAFFYRNRTNPKRYMDS